MQYSRRVLVMVVLFVGSACSDIAGVLGDISGSTGDVHCDRRYVAHGKEPEPFCQEVIDTVAVSQIEDDCREKHHARTSSGKCPRDRIIAGCKLSKTNDDGSEVWDWFYDVSDIEQKERGPRRSGKPHFKNAIRNKDQVRSLCADRKRYEEGAAFTDRP